MIHTLKNLYELPVKSTVYEFGECISSVSISVQRVYQFDECINSDSISSKNVSVPSWDFQRCINSEREYISSDSVPVNNRRCIKLYQLSSKNQKKRICVRCPSCPSGRSVSWRGVVDCCLNLQTSKANQSSLNSKLSTLSSVSGYNSNRKFRFKKKSILFTFFFENQNNRMRRSQLGYRMRRLKTCVCFENLILDD